MNLKREARTRALNVFVASLCFSSCLFGCSGSGNMASVSPTSTTQKAAEPDGPPKTADAAVRRVLDGLRQQNARVVWEFFPPSHRTELEELVHDVAKILDDNTWEATVAVWQKARRVLPPKATAIFGQATDGLIEKDSQPAVSPRSLQRLFDSVGDSELADLKQLRQVDLGMFLEKTGGELLQTLGALPTGGAISSKAFESLAKVEVTLVSTSEDSAIVRMKWPDQEATEHAYVRTNRYWLPKTLVESWSEVVADIRKQAMGWADGLKQQPDSWNARLKAIDQLLDEIAATKSNEDARVTYQRGVQQLAVDWFGVMPTAPTKSLPTPSDLPAKKRKIPDTEEVLPDEK
ncbi:MAG: hypothetical protein NT013_21220 [Planctomycetia bacterium]|nr:hypothetical protein [Planctomycetia bacterium]